MHEPQLHVVLALLAGLLDVGQIAEALQLHNVTLRHNLDEPVGNISSLIHPESRILRGQEVGSALPYMVLIVRDFFKLYKTQHCTGTYLGDGWVLTAQHCAPLKKGEFEIYLGTYDITKPVFKSGISAVYKSPKPGIFSKPHMAENDIMLVKLDRVVPANVKMQSVCLSGWKDIGNVQVKSLGWGSYKCDPKDTGREAVLRQTTGVGLSAEACRKTVSKTNSKTVCVMFQTAGIPANGDSGGPLFIHDSGKGKPLQIGVLSGTHSEPGDKLKCSDTKYPGLYTRLSYHLNWIAKKYPKVCIIGGDVKPPPEPKKQSSCFGSKCKKANPAQKKGVAPRKRVSRNPRDVVTVY